MPSTKLKFSRPRKKNSTGIRPNLKERKKIYNATYRNNHQTQVNLRQKLTRKNRQIQQLQEQIIENNNNYKNVNQQQKILNDENKYLENKTCELEENLEEFEGKQSENDFKSNIVNSFLETFTSQLSNIIKLISEQKLKYNWTIVILFVNLRKYCPSSQITSMVNDVIEIIKEIIQLFFCYINNDWGLIFASLIESLNYLTPKTSTVKNWCTYKMKKITRMHSALHLFNLSKSQNKLIYHGDGSSMQNVSFEGFGICTRNVNIKMNYDMISDFELFQNFINNKNKHSQTPSLLLPKFDDHVLSIAEVLFM